MSDVATDYDGAWKEALELYLEPFLRLCFPNVAAGVDWSQPVEFLDKELQEVVRNAAAGRQQVDKLIKVKRLDGTEEWVLVHIEVQSQPDPKLPARMFRYYHRIADRFDRQVASLAVLADEVPAWRPGPFECDVWGCRVRFEYPSCKLLDFPAEKLEQEDNPAAVVIAAHRAAQATAGDPKERKDAKWRLTRRLYERGYVRKDVLELFRLIDWLVALPDSLSLEFRRELVDYEKAKSMPYVTSIERLGRQEGREEGLLAEARDAVTEVLSTRFGALPFDISEKLAAMADLNRLKALLRLAVTIPSVEDFQKELQKTD